MNNIEMNTEKEKTIFLSYCSHDRDIADMIERAICDRLGNKIRISRYDRDVKYKESFKDFMRGLGDHDYIVTIISSQYLKSRACMFEAGELLKIVNFKQKVLFVVLSDQDKCYYKKEPTESIAANIYDPISRNHYVLYWEKEYRKCQEDADKIESISARIEPYKELREIRNIIDRDIGPFLSYLSDANGLSLKNMNDVNFEPIIDIISSRNPTNNTLIIKKSGISENNQLNNDISQETSYIVSLALLKRNLQRDDTKRSEILVETFMSFGISVKLVGIAHGPTVTCFELSPASGVRISRIKALADDIALSLAVVNVRIVAPIPGKAAVGVEVPNDKVETVPLRSVLESAGAVRHTSRVAVGLGKDNSGRFIIADIAKMPHMLIAGQTGSGKSVCINSIIMSILYRATPDEVKLILIDPKVVELSVYNEIPHLIAPVVTDPKKAASALEWSLMEMQSRYKKFAERGVRDHKGYNKARKAGEKPMPQIVIVINELVDLMIVAPGEVEDSICRLAQLGRAAGMHLVIATQRPSVNVITGVIKANIPTRIAFKMTSQVDSRTILDVDGAEKLLGRGDMLFISSIANSPVRVQGAWVSDDEINDIVSYIKARYDTIYDSEMIKHLENAVIVDAEKDDFSETYDELFPQAVKIVIEAGQASTSMIQRRLRIGYARASRLIDEMKKRGIISPVDGEAT